MIQITAHFLQEAVSLPAQAAKGTCSSLGRLELTLPLRWPKTMYTHSTKLRLICPAEELSLSCLQGVPGWSEVFTTNVSPCAVLHLAAPHHTQKQLCPVPCGRCAAQGSSPRSYPSETGSKKRSPRGTDVLKPG